MKTGSVSSYRATSVHITRVRRHLAGENLKKWISQGGLSGQVDKTHLQIEGGGLVKILIQIFRDFFYLGDTKPNIGENEDIYLYINFFLSQV